MTGLALGVLGRTLLDADLGAYESIGDVFEVVQDQAIFEMMSLSSVPAWVPLPLQRRFRKARAELDRIVAALCRGAALHPAVDGTRDDVLSRLIDATADERGPAARRARMRDELVTLLLAGHDTTASTLSWTLYLLDRYPEVGDRVRAEVDEVLGDRLPTFEDVHRISNASMVLQEVMRLYPAVWLLPRAGGGRGRRLPVPAGADVVLCPYTLHRHTPTSGRTPTASTRRGSPRAARRAGTATATCRSAPGRGSAWAAAWGCWRRPWLAVLLRQLRLSVPSGHQVKAEPMLTLRVKGGLPMTLALRD